MAREVGKMERKRLAMENIGCGWRGSVYGWLIFNVHPRLHLTRLHPTPHAPFEFAFLTSDSTLDTRLSLNARRICSATPQHRYSSTSDSSHPTRSLSLGYPSTLAQLHDR
ncbi:hypothetical protein CNAG_07497 [Cryptococcus neoformans var. grubii H99]|uniref:Uncharacterized protein n=1 Tax=Cryptococcus neoformans (strain H99 / ATCC 208821 / CBS 10515 / FGSC 9487) TaxID=235443 RepID=J9VGT3_CRYN9|nr:hypothetical protein CNAG_07497 [Cryptococcus neoformans var. grubii H99]AFR93602.1 hypothetical protein CNAG_07497 [Cryptococcus neoformans var. grubii H99]AUB23161.1 hypothetical protein CKF44_07497 [Cryptococcus neoformans var. grubii]|eukprot:XP_012048369.1 hypothetical protein CNAG_07497 [Cryptococcus neoformans var. grubii H99]